jgi:hypothetical protein
MTPSAPPGIVPSRTMIAGTQPAEVNMKLANFDIEHLKKLPLRAIVAFAARCARRVESLAQLPEGNPRREARRAAVEAALRMAESFACAADEAPDESVIATIEASRDDGDDTAVAAAAAAVAQAARAAASAWHAGSQASDARGAPGRRTVEAGRSLGALSHVTADLAAMNAYTAAAEAFVSVGYRNEHFVDSALKDYRTLVGLELGRYPEPGKPVDPSPDGPLGRL